MNVFKVLDLEYRKICLELSRVEVGTTDYYAVKKRQEILSEAIEVLRSMSWVKREEVKQKLIFFMDNNFDYSKLAMTFNISKKSAYVLINRAGRQFEMAIGVSIDELINGNISIDNIKIKDSNVVNLFISDIREQLEAKEYNDIDLLECMLELTTLKNLTKATISNRFKKLDVEKISHILHVLQTDKIEYALERELVGAYISGVIKGKEELEYRLKKL